MAFAWNGTRLLGYVVFFSLRFLLTWVLVVTWPQIFYTIWNSLGKKYTNLPLSGKFPKYAPPWKWRSSPIGLLWVTLISIIAYFDRPTRPPPTRTLNMHSPASPFRTPSKGGIIRQMRVPSNSPEWFPFVERLYLFCLRGHLHITSYS